MADTSDIHSSEQVAFGEFRFDPRTMELWKREAPVRLAPKPAKVLAVLLARPGRLVSRSELYAAAWGEGGLTIDLAINSAIRHLRRALGERAGDAGCIQTLPGRGYRFVGEVRQAGQPEPARAPYLRVRQVTAAVAMLAIAVAIGLGSSLATTTVPPTVVVQPFEVLDASGLEETGRVLEASIRNAVARSPGRTFRLLAPDGKPGGGTGEPAYLVRGSLHSSGTGVTRLDIQVVDAASWTIVWSGRFDPDCPYIDDPAANVARYVTRVLGSRTG